MRRPSVLVALLALLSAPAAGDEKVWRLGVLAPTGDNETTIHGATVPELAKEGFVIGRNLVLDERYGPNDALPELARQLAATGPDAIVAVTVTAIRAARGASDRIPIVMSFMGEDPVAAGLVEGLARPGGTITGLVMLGDTLQPKRIQLLSEISPTSSRIAALTINRERQTGYVAAARGAATAMGRAFEAFFAGGTEEFAAAFDRIGAWRADALAILPSPEYDRVGRELTALALAHHLPTVCAWREMARDGCLLAYGPSFAALRRRTASFVARIFRGTPPGELPIEQPTTFELIANARTARAPRPRYSTRPPRPRRRGDRVGYPKCPSVEPVTWTALARRPLTIPKVSDENRGLPRVDRAVSRGGFSVHLASSAGGLFRPSVQCPPDLVERPSGCKQDRDQY